MASADKINLNTPAKHHYARTVISSFFGFFALALIIVSVLVVWLNHTLTDNAQYTKTVAPLVSNPDVQAFAVDKASAALLENKDAPVKDIATQLLGQAKVAGKTDEQLRTEITPIVKDSLKSVIASPQFATLWKDNNNTIHAQLISQLKSDAPSIELNFQPLISGTVNQLSTTNLSFVKDKLELKDDTGKVKLEGEDLKNAHMIYNVVHGAMYVAIGLAIVFFALCVLISVHHWKTVRRVALLTGIFATVLAVILSASSLIKIGGDDAVQQKFAAAMVNGFTHDLRIGLIVIAILGIGTAVGSKAYHLMQAKSKKK